MKLDIFDMFDGLCPDDLPLDESPIDAKRVMSRVRAGMSGAARRPRRMGRAVRTALLAAVLAAFMGVTAWAVGVIRIKLVERPLIQGSMGSGETEEAIEVGFEKTETGPIAPLGVWTVDMPAGYEQTDTFSTADYASTGWTNGKGGGLSFIYRKAGVGLGNTTITEEQLKEKKDVTVNGCPGVLYTTKDVGKLLVWTDEEAGVGFMMSSDDKALDLLALAETVHKTGEKPAPDENALAALEELGDWTVTALPEGYEEYTIQGEPSSQGDGWYAYVNRFYTDAAGHTIQLGHETTISDSYNGYVQYYRDMAGMSQEEMDALEEMGEEVEGMGCTVTDLTVQGRPAGLVTDADGVAIRLAWLAEDGKSVFILSSDSLTPEQLQAAAESVAEAK